MLEPMLQYQIEDRQAYLYVAVSGEVSLTSAEAMYRGVLDAAAQHERRRILMDCTGVTGDWQAAHRLAFGTFMADENRRRDLWPQIAILAVPPIYDPGRFHQAVANNRGIQLRSSDSMQELLSWLGV